MTDFENKSAPKYNRVTPFDVNVEDLLIELLEYMEDREDADHNGDNFVPNKEMTLALNIEQALYQLERQQSYTPTQVKAIIGEVLKEAVDKIVPLQFYTDLKQSILSIDVDKFLK